MSCDGVRRGAGETANRVCRPPKQVRAASQQPRTGPGGAWARDRRTACPAGFRARRAYKGAVPQGRKARRADGRGTKARRPDRARAPLTTGPQGQPALAWTARIRRVDDDNADSGAAPSRPRRRDGLASSPTHLVVVADVATHRPRLLRATLPSSARSATPILPRSPWAPTPRLTVTGTRCGEVQIGTAERRLLGRNLCDSRQPATSGASLVNRRRRRARRSATRTSRLRPQRSPTAPTSLLAATSQPSTPRLLVTRSRRRGRAGPSVIAPTTFDLSVPCSNVTCSAATTQTSTATARSSGFPRSRSARTGSA